MMKRARCIRPEWFLGIVFVLASTLSIAAYKARPWTIRARETYAANLTSEGVTIAVEPLFTDALAGQVFDKNDIVTRGIMPLAIVIFNDNDFPISIDGETVSLIQDTEHYHTLPVNEVVHHLFQKGMNWNPLPRRQTSEGLNQEALADFDRKAMNNKNVEPHSKGGGFLFLRMTGVRDLRDYLANSRVYLPEVIRQDTGAKMIFFEIDLKPAVETSPAKQPVP